eukprot:484254-Alexandrium_andersonii.AAC.1
MSASLVGSEMCIRDRGSSLRNRLLSEFARLFGNREQPRARRRGRLAVSYTHLTLPTICSV